jgi:hypothetical protein
MCPQAIAQAYFEKKQPVYTVPKVVGSNNTIVSFTAPYAFKIIIPFGLATI